MTRHTGRSVTPRRDARRSVTPTRRGRAGRGPLNNLEEETLQEVEEFEEHLLDFFESFPEPVSLALMVSVNGYDRDDLEPHKPWASRLDHTELVEMARCQRREVIQGYPRNPCKDRWMGPVPPEARDNEATLLQNLRWWFFHCKKGSMPPFRYDGAMAFSGDQRDDPMSTPIPRLSSYEGVEVMVVARPLRGAEGMGAAAVGKGHRNTTYTGLRGPEAPKGKGRRRERDRERAQLYMARDPMHRTGYTESAAAPGVEPEVRDPAGLMGAKATNSPDRVEIPPTPPGSRRRDTRTYSPIASSSDEEPPQSTRKLDLEVPADPDDNSFEPTCNLAVLTKSRRKTVLQGLNLLGEHDKALRTLFCPELCCVTCGPKHVVAITSHPSAFQDPMIHCMDIGEAGSGHWDASSVRSTLQEISPSLIIIAVSYPSWDDGLNHNDAIDEVSSHCYVTGVPYLQVDVADTTRWHQQSIPVYPCVGIGDISFISNDEKLHLKDGLAIAILTWHQDHLMMYFLETSWNGPVSMQGSSHNGPCCICFPRINRGGVNSPRSI